jgi:hypothetical protein
VLYVHDKGFSFGHSEGEVIMVLESSRNSLNKYISTHFLVTRLLVVLAFHILRAPVESV